MYKLSDGVLIVNLGDEAAVFNSETGKYFSLNDTGLRMVELIQENHNKEQIIQTMTNEYTIDAKDVLVDFNYLLDALLKNELLSLN